MLSLEASPKHLKNIIKSLGHGRISLFQLHLEREEKGSLEFMWRMRRFQVLEEFSDDLQKQISGVVLLGALPATVLGKTKDIFRRDSSLHPFPGALGNSSSAARGLGQGRKVFLGLPAVVSHYFLPQPSPDCLK